MGNIVVANKLEPEKFDQVMKTLYELLKTYAKDYKKPGSWISFYSETLNVKFPLINFNEGHKVFIEKVIRIFDLMELSHLYCKITDSTKYNKNNHQTVINTKFYIAKLLEEMSLNEFSDLRQHLKSSILFGNN